MRVLFLLPILFLVGCGAVVFEDYNLTETYGENYTENNTDVVHSLYVTLYNPSFFKTANCDGLFKLENEGNISSKKYDLGKIESRSRVKKIINFVMPLGNTTFSLNSNCSFT